MVDKYLSPKLGNTTAISFPAFSGLFPTCNAAAAAAPEEIPTSKPSWRATCFAVSTASSLDIAITSSTTSSSKFPGTKPAPIP
uniref:Uncharacterized protein n=1 Tax=Lotus japonicus TaxID=34305 RepID=I3STT7_LOTJA|nr:unknown [Lotus japonicus]